LEKTQEVRKVFDDMTRDKIVVGAVIADENFERLAMPHEINLFDLVDGSAARQIFGHQLGAAGVIDRLYVPTVRFWNDWIEASADLEAALRAIKKVANLIEPRQFARLRNLQDLMHVSVPGRFGVPRIAKKAALAFEPIH
jgi:hypothetical protein